MYGHHVMESLLEHGRSCHKSRIVSVFLQNLLQFAWDRYGAYVLEKAIRTCDEEHRETLAWALFELSDWDLVAIATNRHKGSIILALLEVSDEISWSFKQRLRTPEAQRQFAAHKHCKRLIQKLGDSSVGSPSNSSSDSGSPRHSSSSSSTSSAST